MFVEIDNKKINVIVKRALKTKNTYIKFDEDLNIIISTNKFTSDKKVMDIILKEEKSILKMYHHYLKKKEYDSKFFFLGKEYKVIYSDSNGIVFRGDCVFFKSDLDIDKELMKCAKKIFSERLDYLYNSFLYSIPKPSSLCIRKMKTRWGVCNTKTKRITLNFELIKKDIFCIDYVIIHELSHLLEANHSKNFWKIVEDNFPDYKKARKMLKML